MLFLLMKEVNVSVDVDVFAYYVSKIYYYMLNLFT